MTAGQGSFTSKIGDLLSVATCDISNACNVSTLVDALNYVDISIYADDGKRMPTCSPPVAQTLSWGACSFLLLPTSRRLCMVCACDRREGYGLICKTCFRSTSSTKMLCLHHTTSTLAA